MIAQYHSLIRSDPVKQCTKELSLGITFNMRLIYLGRGDDTYQGGGKGSANNSE